MADFNTPLTQALGQAKSVEPSVKVSADPSEKPLTGTYDDNELLDLWKVIKHECFDSRWVFERQVQRNIWYTLGRQWIEYQSKYGGWRDKRMAAWIPRPVTNKCKETVQAIRAMFSSIYLSVNIRPNGSQPENVSAAATADELVPLLHEAHNMDTAMSEFDFWLCVTGNAFLHSYVDYDIKHGELVITAEQCLQCQTVTPSTELIGAQATCPKCSGHDFQQATDPTTGEPIQQRKPKGIPATMVLSQLELAFPNSYTRFDELPYVVRMRWRTKRYYESHPVLKDLVPQITWQKAPADHSLALFTSLVQTNDLGITPIYWSEGSGRGGQHDEGIPEYEVWMKPTDAYPDGLVFRVIGDGTPIIVHLDEEGLPGPLPYTDSEGTPLFTYAHAHFEHVGGRILGSGPLDVIIQKQDQLNQHDSLMQLIWQRMANPVWLEPKGAEIQKLTGMPGLVIKWNPLTVGGNAKPERIAGQEPGSASFQYREQLLKDIEELAGTFDVLKGQKPTGVEAFSALQLLVERSQARFASVFRSRGNAYKQWAKFALELERAFGPDERTKAVLTPARGYTFKTFKRAQLQGALSVVVEDGSTTPKTSLGMRASVEHANTLGMLNMSDPDQQYEGLKLFGLTRMVPTLDIHVQAALQKQQAFEEWVVNPKLVQAAAVLAQEQLAIYAQQIQIFQKQTAQQLAGTTDPANPLPAPVQPPAPPPSPLDSTPLKWRPWYNAQIHLQEFLKWANDDRVRELLAKVPAAEEFLKLHMAEIVQNLPQPPALPAPAAAEPQGAGMAMANANQNAGKGAKGQVEPSPGRQTPPKL